MVTNAKGLSYSVLENIAVAHLIIHYSLVPSHLTQMLSETSCKLKEVLANGRCVAIIDFAFHGNQYVKGSCGLYDSIQELDNKATGNDSIRMCYQRTQAPWITNEAFERSIDIPS